MIVIVVFKELIFAYPTIKLGSFESTGISGNCMITIIYSFVPNLSFVNLKKVNQSMLNMLLLDAFIYLKLLE